MAIAIEYEYCPATEPTHASSRRRRFGLRKAPANARNDCLSCSRMEPSLEGEVVIFNPAWKIPVHNSVMWSTFRVMRSMSQGGSDVRGSGAREAEREGRRGFGERRGRRGPQALGSRCN